MSHKWLIILLVVIVLARFTFPQFKSMALLPTDYATQILPGSLKMIRPPKKFSEDWANYSIQKNYLKKNYIHFDIGVPNEIKSGHLISSNKKMNSF